MDSLTGLIEAAGALSVVSTLIFQAVKPFLPVTDTDPKHDAKLRVLLYLVCLAVTALSAISTVTARTPLDVASVVVGLIATAKLAGGAWAGGLTLYHALNGDILGSIAAPPQAPAPVTMPSPVSAPAPTPPQPAAPPQVLQFNTAPTPTAPVWTPVPLSSGTLQSPGRLVPTSAAPPIVVPDDVEAPGAVLRPPTSPAPAPAPLASPATPGAPSGPV